MVNLGDEAVDAVTGFKGVVIGKTEYLNGCARIGLQPKVDKDGKLPDARWFDVPQIKVLKKRAFHRGPQNTGGPLPSMPTRRSDPKR